MSVCGGRKIFCSKNCIIGLVHDYKIEIPVQPTRLAYKLAVAKEIYEKFVKRLAKCVF